MNQAYDEFAWQRAADLTLCPPETLKQHTRQNIAEVLRQTQANGKGATITVHHQPFAMEVAAQMVPRLEGEKQKYVALTIKLIAVRSAGIVDLDE